jgi:hypothetical protein
VTRTICQELRYLTLLDKEMLVLANSISIFLPAALSSDPCERLIVTTDSAVCSIAELASDEGRAVVVVINKWDCVEDQSQAAMQRIIEDVRRQLRPVAWAKIVFTSATQGTVSVFRCMHLEGSPQIVRCLIV